MHSVQIIDPSTGQAHDIPYEQLPQALQAGGQFANEAQKKKAISIQNGTYQDDESSIPATPFNEKSKPMELELTKSSGKKPETMGWQGVKEDAFNLLRNSLKGVVGFGRRYPSEVKEFWSEMAKHPIDQTLHTAGQLAAGIVGGTRDTLNLTHRFFDELADKGVTPNYLRTGSLPEDTGLEKFLGLQPTKKSDELVRAAPAIYGVGKLVKEGVNKVGKVINSPSKEVMFQRALQEEIDKATKAHDLSKEDLKSLQDSLRLKYSELHPTDLTDITPLGQKVDANLKTQALERKRPLTEIPEEHIAEIPPEPDTKAMLQEHKDAIAHAEETAKKNLGTADHPTHKAGKEIKTAIDELHKTSSDLYKEARNRYIGEKVTVDNSKEIKALSDDLKELATNEDVFEGNTSERKMIEDKVQALREEKVNASDLFDLQRSLEKISENVRKRANASGTGITDLERNRLKDMATRLDNRANNIATQLESVGGKEVQKIIKEANKGWKTYRELTKGAYIHGKFKSNPISNAALAEKINANTLTELGAAHPGNDFLNALVENSPELRKNILSAYVGNSSTEKLLNPTTLVDKYIKSLPEVEEHVQALKTAIKNHEQGEVTASKVKKEYDDLVNSMKNAAKQQKIRQEAIAESDELKKQIKFHEDAIPKLEKKIQAEQAAGKNVDRLRDELKKRKQEIQDKGGRLKSIAKFIAKVKGANMVRL
jgi:hypothetical protein